MKGEVKITSTETVKPSSPTPLHLRHYQLSFLDQISPPIYMPLLLFFTEGGTARLDGLKQSLSEALTRFYPLAGRVADDPFIDCNDAGVPFAIARVVYCLHELLRDPTVARLDDLIPRKPDDIAVDDNSVFVVQVNLFDCGGMAIGLSFSHKVGDASSLLMFLRAWTEASRGEVNILSPRFESAALFAPKSLPGFKQRTGIVKESIATKRFVFAISAIEVLREKFSNGSVLLQRRPTRVEALSAFIWTRFMAATTTTRDGGCEGSREKPVEKLYMVQHTVNIRQRMDPPVPENSFGNYYRIAVATPSSALDNNNNNNNIVREMREAIGKIDSDYVRRVREGDEHFKFVKERAERATKGESVSFTFSSLCRFPFYESDFGWGKPVWVASAGMPFRNLVSFLDARSGDGIEAWINLEEEDMEKLEGDGEFLAMVSPCS